MKLLRTSLLAAVLAGLAGASASGVLVPTDAQASVSIAVAFDALVKDADTVGVVTPVESKSVWEEGRIYTYTRVKVEQGVAGELGTGSEGWVRTMGGVVGKIGQLVDGEPVFTREQVVARVHAEVQAVGARGRSRRARRASTRSSSTTRIKDTSQRRRVIRSGAVGVLLPPKTPSPTETVTAGPPAAPGTTTKTDPNGATAEATPKARLAGEVSTIAPSTTSRARSPPRGRRPIPPRLRATPRSEPRVSSSRARVVAFALGAVAGTAALVAAPRAASAFCRTTTVPVVADFQPSPTKCWDQGNPLFWRNSCVGYSVQRSASRQVAFEDAANGISRAFTKWTGASCPTEGTGRSRVSIDVRDLGPVDCGEVNYNQNGANQNVIVFRDDKWPHNDSNNTLALTTVTFNPETGEIYDADMEVNTHDQRVTLTDPVPPDGYDFASIVTHETGHFLGLAHSGDNRATMFANYTPGATAMRNLTADDVAGDLLGVSPRRRARRPQRQGHARPAVRPHPSPRLHERVRGAREEDVHRLVPGGRDVAGDARMGRRRARARRRAGRASLASIASGPVTTTDARRGRPLSLLVHDG